MKHKPKNDYPDNWAEIAQQVKDDAGWCCVRCRHAHDYNSGHVLTVHHLDGDKSNCAWWNIPALCQRCHLHIQSKVFMDQYYLFEHSEWFKPYVAGYYAHQWGLREDRDFVVAHMEELLEIGRSYSNLKHLIWGLAPDPDKPGDSIHDPEEAATS